MARRSLDVHIAGKISRHKHQFTPVVRAAASQDINSLEMRLLVANRYRNELSMSIVRVYFTLIVFNPRGRIQEGRQCNSNWILDLTYSTIP